MACIDFGMHRLPNASTFSHKTIKDLKHSICKSRRIWKSMHVKIDACQNRCMPSVPIRIRFVYITNEHITHLAFPALTASTREIMALTGDKAVDNWKFYQLVRSSGLWKQSEHVYSALNFYNRWRETARMREQKKTAVRRRVLRDFLTYLKLNLH